MDTAKTEVRELTIDELDNVNGGLFWSWVIGPALGALGVGAAAGAFTLGMIWHAESHKH
jgi:lactobin A/cerein 7B family class IIb bacteriocin